MVLASAGTIISKGLQEYDIYNDTKKYHIKGIAPDAKIIPVKALWFGDILYAGFGLQDLIMMMFNGTFLEKLELI